MGLQSSGSISLNDIAGEFGGSTPHSLNEYYGAASGIPASGQISFADFYGASNTPLGIIHFSDPAISNLTNETNSDYRQQWKTDFQFHTPAKFDAGVVNKGGTNYLLVMTRSFGTGTYPKDMNPMRCANMVMCNIDAHPDLDVWTRVNGQSLNFVPSNWYVYDPANGYDADGNSVSPKNTQINSYRGAKLVVCRANNAATIWMPEWDRSDYPTDGIYRDYDNSPSEVPFSGYWGEVSNDPIDQGLYSGGQSFSTKGFVKDYASSETSTIVITETHRSQDPGYESYRNFALRTTDGYNYGISGMNPFPNEYVHALDGDTLREYYWRPRAIAYGNGVWVIARDNLGIPLGGYGGHNTRHSAIYSTNDGLTWNTSNTYFSSTNTTGGVQGVAFGNGMFILNTFHKDTNTPYLYTSTDGANWTKIEPTYNGGSWRFFDNPYNSYFHQTMTYGNGRFIINYTPRIRTGSSSSSPIITPNGFYSIDNGQNWQSFAAGDPYEYGFIDGADIFLSTGVDGSGTEDDLFGMYRLE